jgi:hypothetical protein
LGSAAKDDKGVPRCMVRYHSDGSTHLTRASRIIPLYRQHRPQPILLVCAETEDFRKLAWSQVHHTECCSSSCFLMLSPDQVRSTDRVFEIGCSFGEATQILARKVVCACLCVCVCVCVCVCLVCSRQHTSPHRLRPSSAWTTQSFSSPSAKRCSLTAALATAPRLHTWTSSTAQIGCFPSVCVLCVCVCVRFPSTHRIAALQ